MGPARPRDALNIADLERQAHRRLPRAVYDAVAGGAGDELTLRENRQAFDRIWLRPRVLNAVGERDLLTTVLGERVSMPVLLAPCGFSRMCDSDAELAIARAAGRAGTVFVVSAAASVPPEDIAAAATAPLWYQMFLLHDEEANEAIIARAERLGFRALCVTVDTAVTPLRDRDYRNRLTVPLRPSPRLIAAGLSRPRWTKDFVLGKVGRGTGFGGARVAYWNLAQAVISARSVTVDDIARLRDRWRGPLVVKGIVRGDEARTLVDVGVDGIIVSNHGGRNLDGCRATVDALPEVVDAVGGEAEVFLDGGIRRGVDVLKALALGARACLVGRPYMYGLAAGGEEGVARTLEILRVEVEKAMGLSGCATVADADGSLVGRPPGHVVV